MRVEKDFEELLKVFNRHKVKYCIIGAFAFGFYAKPRYTKDMDILIEPSSENGIKIVNALKDFGFGSLGLNPPLIFEFSRILKSHYNYMNAM